MIKDEEELNVMVEAALVGCSLFDHILGFIGPEFRRLKWLPNSSTRPDCLVPRACRFETIVASGVRSALPHGRATRRLPVKDS